ncbi:MAG: DUF4190 domain-containing protein [Ilumatobacteraceae bacterium]
MSDFPNRPPEWDQRMPAASPYYFPPVQSARTSGLAIASMVLGILWLWWVGSILAVIFGHVAISQTSRDPYLGGKGMAIAGLVLGYIGVGFLLLFIVVAAAASSA